MHPYRNPLRELSQARIRETIAANAERAKSLPLRILHRLEVKIDGRRAVERVATNHEGEPYATVVVFAHRSHVEFVDPHDLPVDLAARLLIRATCLLERHAPRPELVQVKARLTSGGAIAEYATATPVVSTLQHGTNLDRARG